jgi:magnesium chelatase subunit I
MRLKRGILSRADRNLLYVDEVNMLTDQVVDAILDAAAQGQYTVRRGAMSATYRSDFTLIGSMNPEEGRLRPQIMDRFGLRVIVEGLTKKEDRLNAYQRSRAYQENKRAFWGRYWEETRLLRDEIQACRDDLNEVVLSDQTAQIGLELIEALEIDSLRAEITLFESARAHAIADTRKEVTLGDVRTVAPMALRLRQSPFIEDYLHDQNSETELVLDTLDGMITSSGDGE